MRRRPDAERGEETVWRKFEAHRLNHRKYGKVPRHPECRLQPGQRQAASSELEIDSVRQQVREQKIRPPLEKILARDGRWIDLEVWRRISPDSAAVPRLRSSRL